LADSGRSLKGEIPRAQRRAAEPVESIRVSTRSIVSELTLSGIASDVSADKLEQRILDSPAFSTRRALMLTRKALPAMPEKRRQVY
jgi:hypothetical protein